MSFSCHAPILLKDFPLADFRHVEQKGSWHQVCVIARGFMFVETGPSTAAERAVNSSIYRHQRIHCKDQSQKT